MLAVGDDGGAVDEHPLHAGGVLVGLVEGGGVAEGFGVEDHHVGVVAGLQRAAIFELEDFGGEAGAAADGGFDGDGAVLDGVAADLAGEGAVAARVRHGVAGGLYAAVAGRRHPRPLHVNPHVLLVHAEVHDLRAAVTFDFHHDVDRLFHLRFGDLSQVLALPRRVLGIAGDLDSLAAITPRQVFLNVRLHLRPGQRVVHPRDEVFLRAFAVLAGHQCGAKAGTAGDVRVLVSGDDLPFGLGVFDQPYGPPGHPPRLLTARLDVRNVDATAGLLADRKRFLNRRQ